MVARLDRPKRLDASTVEVSDEFVRLRREVESDAAARLVVLTGTGRAFCAVLDRAAAGTLPGMPVGCALSAPPIRHGAC